MKHATKKRMFGYGILAIVLAVTMVIGLLPGKALAAGIKASDTSTETRYTESLGHDASTEYAGRIWTDKSVWSGDAEIELMDGSHTTIENDSDFLVSFSALATAQSVTGSSQAPVDVVFVIDTSGSMQYNMSSTDDTKRIKNTVDALNSAIDTIMNLNEYTRVAVAAFSSTSEILLPLGRYEKGTRTSGNGWNQTTVENYFSLNNSNTTLYVHAEGEGSTNSVTDSRSVTGGTNIQRGIYEGMNILATEGSTSVNVGGSVVQRVPAVILLSDGAPTYSVANTQGGWGSSATYWWNPANNDNDGDGNNPYYGNGMKALMTGAYMKEAVNRNYGVTGTKMETTMYTVGMGITGLSNESEGWNSRYTGEQDLAYMTLNPGAYWNDDNVMSEDIVDAWETYITNDGTPRVDTDDNETYTFTHPSQYDIDTDADALKNLVDGYYDADSAASVTNVFAQIVSNISISSPEVPTEMEHTDAMNTGYITYTDPLGEYMELKDVKGIIYKGVVYDQVTDNGDGTYTVSQSVTSDIYGEQNLNGVKISVSTVDGVETVKIQIPASLIPVRINTVELNTNGSVKSHTNNGSFPMRVLYTVGLADGLVEGTGEDAYVKTELLSEEYLAANTVDGKINFYSNLYTGENVVNNHTAGNTTVEFEPSHTNPFYYMQSNDAIYTDEACTTQLSAEVGIKDDVTYYYKTTHYEGTSAIVKGIARTGAQLKRTEIIEGADGYLYREAGSPRLNRILEFEGTKSENPTNTAKDFYAPTFVHDDNDPDPAAGKYVIYLGNNGVLSIVGYGALEITKNVVIPEGLSPDTTEFEFTVDLNGEETLAGEFNYTIAGTETKGTVADGGTLKLKAGETARITGLPRDTAYTVTEKDYTSLGFTTQKTGDTGTIAAGETDSAVFTNTYSATSIEFPPTGDSGFTGKKILDGRAWINGTDSYSFLITPYNNAPLPANYNAETGVTVTSGTMVDGDTYEAGFDFGKITFTQPGIYRYTVVEREPETSAFLPGITYSRALYRVVITVEDNGQGELTAAADIQKLYTDDANPLFTYDVNSQIVMNLGQEGQDEIVFTNTYEAKSVTRTPVAVKTYVDESGATKLLSGMFTFKLEALGYCVGDYSASALVSDKTIPMPEGSVNGVVTTTNEGTNVTFPSVTFTDADLKGATKITYRYKITEVAGDTEGMTYDVTEYYANVIVSADGTTDTLSVVAQYLDAQGQDVRIPSFTNTLDPEDVSITKTAESALHGNKTITGRTFAADDEFKFTLTAANDAAKQILASPETVVMDAATGLNIGSFWFDDMTFSKVGEYKFTITEEKGNQGGITYDTDTTEVTVTVTLNEAEGKLEAAVVYANAEEGASTTEASFENVYTSTFTGTPVSLSGTKTLTGKELVEGEFYFEVEEVNENEEVIDSFLVTHKADSNADGIADITFLEEVSYDKAGTYTYLISEQIPAIPVGGTDYDLTEYRFTVTVTDDGVGNLSVSSQKLEKKAEGAADFAEIDDLTVEFVNSYSPNPLTVPIPAITKVISGDRKDALKADEFTFRLSLISADPLDGVELPNVTEVKNDADGTVSFGNMTFKKAGYYSIRIEEVIPSGVDEDPTKEGVQVDGITYSTSVITATIHVTDDRNGNLSLAVAENIGGKTITNVYETEGSAKLTIEKVLTGREWKDTDTFEFEIVIEDPATLEALEKGDIVFPHDGDEIYKLSLNKAQQTVVSPDVNFYKPGTYKFLIHEINGGIPGVLYDEARHEVIVTCEDNGDGTMTVSTNYEDNTLTFTNVYDDESAEISGHSHLAVNKVFTGREDDAWFDTDAFVFTLSAADALTQAAVDAGDIELPDNANGLVVTSANKSHAHFGNIIFHKANASGENYKFVVKELSTNAELAEATDSALTVIPGVAYDQDKDREIVVHVESNGEGLLITSVVENESEALTFTNTYSTKEVTLNAHENLVVTKELVGRDWFSSDSFDFTLEAINGTVQAVADGDVILPDSVKATQITATDNQYQDAFADDNNPNDGITFRKKGVYSFIVKEVQGSIKNIAYDGHSTIVTVTVEDDGNGNLVVAAVSYTGSMTFENTYTPDAIPVVIEGKKTLTGGRTLADGDFTFVITAIDGAPMPAKSEVTNVGNSVSFGAVNYAKAGTYEYIVTERKGNMPGISYDQGEVKVTVTVTYDEETGLLSGTASYEKAKTSGTGFEFINTYKAEETDPITIGAIKTVTPSAGNSYTLEADDFSFKIKPAAGNPQPDPISAATVSNDKGGKVTFASGISFTQEGTWSYTVSEVSGDLAGISYDGSVYLITFVVTDDNGKLKAAVTVEKDGKTVSQGLAGITFENGYDPDETSVIISGEKNLLGDHKDLEAGEFTFKLEGKAGAPMPTSSTTTNEVTGIFAFGEIEYTAPGDYEYTVTEVNDGEKGYSYSDASFAVVVTVKDVNGELKASVTGVKDAADKALIVFNNTYIPVSTDVDITGTKKIVDADGKESLRKVKADEFTFELLDRTGKTVATAKTRADGTFVFEDVPFEKAGDYSYTVIEKASSIAGITDDTSVFAVDVKVVDEGGELKATVTYPKDGVVFKNVYKALPTSIKLSAIKKLSGRDLVEDEFTFELLDENGKIISTAKNTKEGVVIFEEIPYAAAGTYKYTIREVKGDAENVVYDETVHTVEVIVKDGGEGYLVAKLSNDGVAVVFENTYQAPDPEVPQMGDESAIGFWITALVTSLLLAVSPLVFKKRNARK